LALLLGKKYVHPHPQHLGEGSSILSPSRQLKEGSRQKTEEESQGRGRSRKNRGERHSRKMAHLIPDHNPYHIHKVLGLLVLLHYLHRYYLIFAYGTAFPLWSTLSPRLPVR
jgi:hypothetical protein